jgi:site-specific DNA-cytosine methylase
MTTSSTKWATIIPLIGGSAVGCYQATGNKPLYHLSYSAFRDNEKHLTKYWSDVPRIELDKGETPVTNLELDFVNSVCPCAGLSQLNASRDSTVRDEKNQWMFESAEHVMGTVKPKVFFGENAPGLFTNSGQSVLNRLRSIGESHNYSMTLYRTNTMLHGIPQRRVRTFYFFWRGNTAPLLGWFKRNTPPYHEYIKEIPPSATLQNIRVINSLEEDFKSYDFLLMKSGKPHEEFVKGHDNTSVHSVYSYLEKNGYISECISWLETNYPDSKEIKRLKKIRDKAAAGGNYMDSSPGFYYERTNALVGRTLNYLLHPVEKRSINLRESLHMMGLPHDFEFTNLRDINHIAQNVPTCTAKDMASEVLKYINGELPDSGKDFVKQCNISEEVV